MNKYWSFLDPSSPQTDQQFHLVLVYLTQLNDPSLSKIIDKRFNIAPYVCANIELHPQLKHSLRELAHLYFNGDIRPRETVNGLRLIKLLDVVNNLHHKRKYMYTRNLSEHAAK